ncbi:hypothetical protein ACTXGQ_18950 [Marinobacter sp. 1Y8]
MTNKGDSNNPQAGSSSKFPSGTVSYLAPFPLPTGCPAIDHSHIVAEVNEEYLELGSFTPNVFGWQLTIGIPMSMLAMTNIALPFLMLVGGFVWGEGLKDGVEAFIQASVEGFKIGLAAFSAILFFALVPRFQAYFKLKGIVPTRFHRQRREVCLVPSDSETPIFVPWEDLQAWVVQAQGVTQYGVQRQYGFGFGGIDPKTGVGTNVELMSNGLPSAISTWEALRAYMEYEVNTLKEMQDSLELQKPGDPPWEGVHTFYNARDRMRRRRREGDVGVSYPFFWYLYHVFTLWTLPNYLTEWEVRKVQRLNRRALPDDMEVWSQPLPETEWVKPSDELIRQSEAVRARQKASPGRPITEILTELHAQQSKNGATSV